MYKEEPEESVLFDKHLEPKENPSFTTNDPLNHDSTKLELVN